VLIADDHTIVREGLARLLEDHNFKVVASVSNGEALLASARQLRPQVIVTDISMPAGPNGLDVLLRLRTERIDSKVIVLTMHMDADLATRAARSGASGYLLKESAGEELVSAIHQVLRGRICLSPAITKEVMERLASPASRADHQLTTRQREVLRLIVAGHRMKEVAAKLGLSTRTVEFHKYEMMRVLEIQSTAELVKYAIEHRLVFD
jgi:DNA-binding NarL/FixJ family response regulator